jgi:hypothetical protein
VLKYAPTRTRNLLLLALHTVYWLHGVFCNLLVVAHQYSIVKDHWPFSEAKTQHPFILDSDSWILTSFAKVVGLGRLELPTSSLSGTRSSHLSYRPKHGGAGRDRTGDLLNANQALSQLSYSPFIRSPVLPFSGSSVQSNRITDELKNRGTVFLLEADWMLPDGTRPNRQNNIRELSSGDPRRLWTGKAVTYFPLAYACGSAFRPIR